MRRSFGSELLLLAVTLGLYMPYWLWARNDALRKALPDLDPMRNEVFLGVGIVLATFARAVFGGANDLIASFLSVAGIALFAYGVYVLADNAERAAESLGIAPRIPAWVVGAGVGLAFSLVEAGNAIPSWTVREELAARGAPVATVAA
jgi:hypothetical protein